ncbi:MAG TPA: methyltransferase [Caulobacteraceae bacterium]|nr:methyltransferase [Caulobacteraceae bacterium]
MSESGWRDRWLRWRNGLLSNPRFQRWAADFPLTRPIAHKRAQALFDLVAGFVYSQTLQTCTRLGVLDYLRRGPATPEALVQTLGLPLDSVQRLLSAADALGLVQRTGGGRYALGPQGAALLGNAGLIDMINHHQHLYADLADGVGLLRRGGGQGKLAAFWPYATASAPQTGSAAEVADYSALMAASLPALAEDVFAAYPIGRHRRLLDVGGGEGAFLAAAGAHAPGLKLMLFDLPSVTVRACERLINAGLANRVEIFGGDFLSGAMPDGADLITLIRILHDHDDDGVMTLLRSAYAALPVDGALLIAEPMSSAPRADRVADAYFALYLLAMGRGRARTPAEIADMLRAAGFRRIRQLRTRSPFLMRAIVARP